MERISGFYRADQASLESIWPAVYPQRSYSTT
jgi:hypothetical protein